MSAILIHSEELTGTVTRCPGCGSGHTAAARTPARQNLLCKTCGSCWQLAQGSAERVSPWQCPGCALRRVCTAAAG